MQKLRRTLIAVGALSAVLLLNACAANAQKASTEESDGNEYLVYIGTRYEPDSPGIYACRFNDATGELLPLGVVAETANSDFLAVHPNERFLYATGETVGTVAAFAIDKSTGKLTFLNKVDTGGEHPTHLDIDHTGRAVIVANFSGGNTVLLPINEDGRLGEISANLQHPKSSVDPEQQQCPHAVSFSPDNRFVVVPDIAMDKFFIFRFDAAAGSLVFNDPPFVTVNPGAGPRHFSFHPTGRFAYGNNQMENTVTAFSYDAERGALTVLQTISTLPKGFEGTSPLAEVLVHPSGRFLYNSNRGHSSIAVFSIDSEKGTLTPIEIVSSHGEWPQNFRFDPTGRYMVVTNRTSDTVVVFRVDEEMGWLTSTGQEIEVNDPECVRFVSLD